MAEYIGRRIVPTHGGVWNETKEYEELTIVLDEESGDSYISRIPVPSGTALDDEEYWMLFSIYSEQIQEALDAIEETSEELKEYVNTTAASLTEYVQETAEDLTAYVDKTADALTAKVEEAEDLTESNTDTLNDRMDNIETRLDANVTASTDSDSDYAAEVVDARIDADGTTYASLGKHIRSIESGDAMQEIDFSKVTWAGLSMQTFYDLFVAKNSSYFTASYDEETDTLTITCLQDYSGDFILYAPMWTAEEYARMCRIGGTLLMKFQTSDVVNDNSAFKIALWTGTTSSADSLVSGTPILSAQYQHVFKTGSGEYELAVTFNSSTYDYDEDLSCYVSGGSPVYLELLLYANSPKEGDSITVCGNGGLFAGVRENGKDTAFCLSLIAGEINDLSGDVSDLTDRVDEDEDEIERIALADAQNCRSYDFTPSGVFGPGNSTYEVVEDEYGDSSYHIAFVSNNPMYQQTISSLLNEGDKEIIVELTARAITEGSQLRVQLYNKNTGTQRSGSGTYYQELTTAYHRYQIKMTFTQLTNLTLGIGPRIVSGYEVQFKDVKLLIPNEDAKMVEQPLKYFCGYPDDLDFSEGTAVSVDNPLYFGFADYASEDDLYLDTLEFYASAKGDVTICVGCLDQYSLLQTLSSFSYTMDAGRNFLNLWDKQIQVPSGYGVFIKWNSSMAVYSGMPDYGIENLISTEDNYYENDAGYSGYPLEDTEYMVPFRYTLVEKPFNIAFEELQESVESTAETVEDMGDRVTALEEDSSGTGGSTGTSLIDPYGVKYSLLVGQDGTISTVRSIPNKAVVYGNSLTLGFGTFGMAASDSDHDWYHYVYEFLLEKNEDLEMSRYSMSSWEGMTDSDSRSEYVDTRIAETADGTEDLIIIQLSDNVNTTEKKATFAEDMYTILAQFRTACPNARIMWIAAWYNWSSNYEFIENACTDLGIDLVDIRDLSTDSENQSAVGNTYSSDDGTVNEITSTGVASHPGDTGMELIAERVIEVLESYM